MIKRTFAAILLLAVFACLSVPAFADILWEPDDDYYSENREDTDYVGAGFTQTARRAAYPCTLSRTEKIR